MNDNVAALSPNAGQLAAARLVMSVMKFVPVLPGQ